MHPVVGIAVAKLVITVDTSILLAFFTQLQLLDA